MKKEDIPHRFESLSDAHQALGLPKPLHPLISLIDSTKTKSDFTGPSPSHVLSVYKISYKPKLSGRLKYGQGYYDFDEGGLLFAAPNQVIGGSDDHDINTCSQYTLLIHPDFLLSYPLAKKIKQYGFFSYSANETLHLSETEKATIISVFKIIEEELNSRIDDFSQDVIISQIELLLNYANRFYKRQFITRKAASNDLLQRLEELLDGYFNSEKSLTGQNAQHHIHAKLIEKAKEKLSAKELSVSEVAYSLGFEHPQSFSKFFKTKTSISPVAFRRSFN
jgi:AraC family transcriptional regulator, transcriptional activator of pobA